jgi:hypothetical protein
VATAKKEITQNLMRAEWRYQRTALGDAVLASGKGLSPAFLKLLDAVSPDNNFKALSQLFPHLDRNDIEVWVAELCMMGYVVPWTPKADGAAEEGEGAAKRARAGGRRCLLAKCKLPNRPPWTKPMSRSIPSSQNAC